jgi:hypothetical protein
MGVIRDRKDPWHTEHALIDRFKKAVPIFDVANSTEIRKLVDTALNYDYQQKR